MMECFVAFQCYDLKCLCLCLRVKLFVPSFKKKNVPVALSAGRLVTMFISVSRFRVVWRDFFFSSMCGSRYRLGRSGRPDSHRWKRVIGSSFIHRCCSQEIGQFASSHQLYKGNSLFFVLSFDRPNKFYSITGSAFLKKLVGCKICLIFLVVLWSDHNQISDILLQLWASTSTLVEFFSSH